MRLPTMMAWRAVRSALAVLTVAATGLFYASTANAQACTQDCLTPGDYTYTMTWGGAERTYQVHVPASYTGAQPVPLLLDMHGWNSNADQQKGISGQLAESDARGFIAVWPSGLNDSWNGFNCCGTSRDSNVDDVGFLKNVVATIRTRANINAARVYATGLSAGASMSYRLACDAADVFKAVTGVSQMLNRPELCHPSRPITVYEYHGLLDALAPYIGSPLGFQSARQSFASWATIHSCSGTPVKSNIYLLNRMDTYITCAGGVQVGLVTITAAEHIAYINVGDFKLAPHMWEVAFSR